MLNIPSKVLRQLVELSERKDALLEQVQKIEHEMLELQKQYAETLPPHKAAVTFSRQRGKRRPRALLKRPRR